MNDSTHIIEYLQGKYGDAIDEGASAAERAQMVAFNRMIDEHTYWVAVIQPRWRETENWEKYLRIIAGTNDVPPGLRAVRRRLPLPHPQRVHERRLGPPARRRDLPARPHRYRRAV